MIALKEFFTDPVLIAPTIGSMLMGLVSALVGVLVYVRRRALIGETLSHATYPGIVFGVICLSGFNFPIVALIGAFLSGMLGLYLIHYLEETLRLNSDTALCFVLSTFLGIGVLFASRLQFTNPIAFQKVQALLYGQAATLLLIHIYIYAILSALVALFVIITQRALKVVNFDRDFAKLNGLTVKTLDYVTIVLIVLAIVIGIRSVGVVLMAGMLIAPAVTARQFAKTFGQMFVFSSLFGIVIGWGGMVLSVNATPPLPTGPVILVVATLCVILALVFGGKRGLLSRWMRRHHFKVQCLEENILKYIYKANGEVTKQDIAEVMRLSCVTTRILLSVLEKRGFIKGCVLTDLGNKKAERIIRLHRLWEVYLFTCLDVQAENVHKSAEEMEHIITPELEEELIKLLGDPKKDPHNQTIPEKK